MLPMTDLLIRDVPLDLNLRLNLESGGFDGWVALAWSAA
jgi:hypothetical protein